jgi:hypothetical protein
VDLATFSWLLTDEGQQLLDEAAQTNDPEGRQLRNRYSGDQVAAALTQVELRNRAEAKFGELAQRMYFTTDALEQATKLSVSQHRAARIRTSGLETIIDLGCGIGGDLITFAMAGLTAAGVDLDPLRVAMAEANLAAAGVGGATMVADATTVNLDPFDVAFIDPARRTGRGRTFNADAWQPSWDFVTSLLNRDAVVKTAPGIDHALIPAGVEAEWVSDRGEVKEAALWSGRLVSVRRRATVISQSGLVTMTDEDESNEEVVDLGRYLYEPDGAVIRAGLVGAVAAGVGGGLLDSRIAYVTSDSSFRTPFAKSYVVNEEVPFREKQLRAALKVRGIGRLTIKKRGIAITPEELRKRLELKGDNEATLVLTRVRGQGTALLVTPF